MRRMCADFEWSYVAGLGASHIRIPQWFAGSIWNHTYRWWNVEKTFRALSCDLLDQGRERVFDSRESSVIGASGREAKASKVRINQAWREDRRNQHCRQTYTDDHPQ